MFSYILKEEMGEKSETGRDLPSVGSLPKGPPLLGYVRPKPETGASCSHVNGRENMHLEHVLLSQVHEKRLGLEVDQPRLDLVRVTGCWCRTRWLSLIHPALALDYSF